jgi:hypothetical protein
MRSCRINDYGYSWELFKNPRSERYVGPWDGPIGAGGDCADADLLGTIPVMLDAHRVYRGNVTMVHETMAVPEDCFRTVVRLNVPGVHL